MYPTAKQFLSLVKMKKHISISGKAVEKFNFSEDFLKENINIVTALPLLHDNVRVQMGFQEQEYRCFLRSFT